MRRRGGKYVHMASIEATYKALLKTVTFKLEIITPEKAANGLAASGPNRSPVSALLDRYLRDIVGDRWEFTGQPIIYSTQDKLLDGQHRLLACVESGKPIIALVVRGVPPKAFAKMDIGRSRTAGDVLSASNFNHAKLIAAAARALLGLEMVEQEGASASKVRWNQNVSHTQIRDYARKHKEGLYNAVEEVYSHGPEARSVLRPSSVFVAMRVRLGQANGVRAKEFFHALVSGADMVEDDPRLLLRNTLIRVNSDKIQHRGNAWKAAVTIKTWNAFLNDEEIRALRWQDGEGLPKIRSRGKR